MKNYMVVHTFISEEARDADLTAWERKLSKLEKNK